MESRKNFSLSFSLQQEGADLDDPLKVDAININWILTMRAMDEFLPPALKELFRATPKQQADNFSGRMTTLVTESSPHLSDYERAFVEAAIKDGRKDIYDIGVRLTHEKGLPEMEGGFTLISQLQKLGWKPVSFTISEKSSTEQRIVDGKESLKKIFFTVSFKRESSPESAIDIPESVLIVLATQATWRFAHIWYNPVILHTVNVNFTALWWNIDPVKRLPHKWVIIP